MNETQITKTVAAQRAFYLSQQTKAVAWRKEQLTKLRDAIISYEAPLYDALWQDLHKSQEEAFLTEVSIVLQEIKRHLAHIDRWARPQRVGGALSVIPSKSYIMPEPLGVALIVAPWNYPFQLLINPLVGAISSGCCAVLKSSPNTPTVARVMTEMIESAFSSDYIAIFEGGRDVNTQLFAERYDVICLTGSPQLGKVVMQAAAKHLTPTLLELGGKSPCIVDASADIEVAARRIIWGKTINSGQTCIAPDYLFVHRDVKEPLIEAMRRAIKAFFGDNPKDSGYYGRIVSDDAMTRLSAYLREGRILIGGETDAAQRYIAPTLIDNVTDASAIMQEEIFGPILPMMTFADRREVIDYVNAHEKPLALYVFGDKSAADHILGSTTSGGACVNDTLLHIANPHLPFGGVGNSGMGKYHFRRSFLAFSNERAVLRSVTWFDLKAKFAPFKGLKPLMRFLR